MKLFPDFFKNNETKDNLALLYINIPFCKYKCNFCCFTGRMKGKSVLSAKTLMDEYLKALVTEIRAKGEYFRPYCKKNFLAINFGGGTPSLLSAKEMEILLNEIRKNFRQKLAGIKDISLEVTPDSLTSEKIKAIKDLGFNRISLGLQTFNEKLLKTMNRGHSLKDFYSCYENLVNEGIENLNLDLIYGVPFQTFKEYKRDLKKAVELSPAHISPSPYAAAVFSGYSKKKFPENEDFAKNRLKWAEFTFNFLSNAGYRNYFHKYFAKKGFESRTELVYFYSLPYIGLGAGAENPGGNNTNDIKKYLSQPVTGLLPETILFRDPVLSFYKQLLFPEGIDIDAFKERFSLDLSGLDFEQFREGHLIKQIKGKTERAYFSANRKLRGQLLFKLIDWRKKRILTEKNGKILIHPSKRFYEETWELYMYSV